MNKNVLMILVFLLIVILLFSILEIEKIDAIGTFFKKIVEPVSIPLSAVLSLKLGLVTYKQIKNKDLQ